MNRQELIESIQKNKAITGSPNNMPAMGELSNGSNQYSKKMTPEERKRKADIEEVKNGKTYGETEDLW